MSPNSKKIIASDDMPYANRKVYELIQSETGGNVKAFARSINVSQQSLNRIFCIDKRNGKYPSISNEIKQGIIDVYGKDEIWFISDAVPNNEIGESNKNLYAISASQQIEKDYKLIPLIHIDSVGGMHSKNDVMDEPEYIEKYVPFLDACDGDKAIFQTGDSMIPTIPPGSILQIRRVDNWREYFGYGGIFVLLLTDGRRITKEVSRYEPDPKNYVMCISHNPSVPDEELPKSLIASVWKVIKILTNRGW